MQLHLWLCSLRLLSQRNSGSVAVIIAAVHSTTPRYLYIRTVALKFASACVAQHGHIAVYYASAVTVHGVSQQCHSEAFSISNLQPRSLRGTFKYRPDTADRIKHQDTRACNELRESRVLFRPADSAEILRKL